MINDNANNDDLRDALQKMAEDVQKNKNSPQKFEKKINLFKRLIKPNIPYWLKFGWLFWAISFFVLLIPSWLYKISEGHCDLLPDLYCIPAIASTFLSYLMVPFEYPVNIALKLLDPYNQYYSERMFFQFDLPKILLTSLIFLIIGIMVGLIVEKISKKTIEPNKNKLYYLAALIIITLFSLTAQFQNYKKHSEFNTSITETPAQNDSTTKKEIISYQINSYADFDNSPFCKTYNCNQIDTGTGDKFHKYELLADDDFYLEVVAQNNQLESILINNLDSRHKMKGNDLNIFFDLLRSIDSGLEIDDPRDSAVDYIISHIDSQSIYGNVEATTWGPVYSISAGRENGDQGMYVWRR